MVELTLVKGFVVSDWGGLHSIKDAPAGLDMAMPDANNIWGKNLLAAVKNGIVSEARFTDMAMR